MADYTTARIYMSDAKRLLRLQLIVAELEGELPAVADVIRRLLDAAEAQTND
jgi:hypothetical protein